MGECPILFHSEKVGGWIKGGGTLLSKVPLAKEGHQLPAQNNITEIQDTTMIDWASQEWKSERNIRCPTEPFAGGYQGETTWYALMSKSLYWDY